MLHFFYKKCSILKQLKDVVCFYVNALVCNPKFQ